jgi:hypothetical protein
VVLRDDGVCCSFGTGAALGLGPKVLTAPLPTPVTYLRHYRVVAVACGARHTLAIALSIPEQNAVCRGYVDCLAVVRFAQKRRPASPRAPRGGWCSHGARAGMGSWDSATPSRNAGRSGSRPWTSMRDRPVRQPDYVALLS